ncbi:MarR family winged helix-turn-helix transcriptional regulator [Niallia sp. 01092]|uniref:MarR family winged helix-turn-helix transcriptional regulator n=1 Tax=unclassified Niallia TaxID=2837522 RepID=UPI003FD31C3C
MKLNEQNRLLESWLSFTQIQANLANELESALQEAHTLSLREFYVLLFLSKAPDKKLRLQQLHEMVGLSQSALSRLVARMEAKSCGALERHICQDDRRGIYTSLTSYGQEKLQAANETFHQTLATALSSKKLQQDIKEVTQQLTENV